MTPRIASGPRRAAVVGHPISHSLSPLLHTTAYRALGLTDWAYEAHDVRPGELSTFLAGCGDEWVGLSVTMPHKVDAALLAAARAPSVERTGVANTLLRSPRGWQAHNTDIEGIVGSLRGWRGWPRLPSPCWGREQLPVRHVPRLWICGPRCSPWSGAIPRRVRSACR